MHTVLLVEDDVSVRAALARALDAYGYTTLQVGTAADALRDTTSCPPDLVILDLGLPDLDGITTLRMIRSVSDVPVIVASATGDERTIVGLLDAGADDYLVKPFSSQQLRARIRSLLRRVAPRPAADDSLVEVGQLLLDRKGRTARLGDRQLALTRMEFDLLTYLAQNRGKVVTRSAIMRHVWGTAHHEGADGTVDVHVSILRRKLGETAATPRYLHTVRGVGLKLVEPE